MASPPLNKIVIRPAASDDLESYRELRLEALKNHPDTFGQAYEDAASRDQEYWKNTLNINNNEKALYFAISDAKLVGMTGIYRNLSRKSRHAATIWGVYVKPEWRGNYISESLIRACLKWAKEQELIIVKLAAVTDNIPAINCYKRCGFKIYGTEPKAIYHDGVYYDEHLMSIDIN